MHQYNHNADLKEVLGRLSNKHKEETVVTPIDYYMEAIKTPKSAMQGMKS